MTGQGKPKENMTKPMTKPTKDITKPTDVTVTAKSNSKENA